MPSNRTKQPNHPSQPKLAYRSERFLSVLDEAAAGHRESGLRH